LVSRAVMRAEDFFAVSLARSASTTQRAPVAASFQQSFLFNGRIFQQSGSRAGRRFFGETRYPRTSLLVTGQPRPQSRLSHPSPPASCAPVHRKLVVQRQMHQDFQHLARLHCQCPARCRLHHVRRHLRLSDQINHSGHDSPRSSLNTARPPLSRRAARLHDDRLLQFLKRNCELPCHPIRLAPPNSSLNAR